MARMYHSWRSRSRWGSQNDHAAARTRISVSAQSASSRAVRVGNVANGSYEHAHARANGKVLLAWAPVDVREAYLEKHPLEKLTPTWGSPSPRPTT